MCAGCYSVIAAAGSSVPVVTAMAAHTWDRVRIRSSDRPRIETEIRDWDSGARFLRDHGVDPVEALGPRPDPPTSEIAPLEPLTS